MRAAPYAFISPFYILFAVFMVVPIGGAIYLSLTVWSGIGSPTWAGFANYIRLFGDGSFYTAGINTLIYVLISVLVVVPLSLLVAQALNVRGLKFRDFWRVTYFVPMIVSPIVVALIFGLLYDQQFGLINVAIQSVIGAPKVDWLGDPTLAKVSVGILVVWRWTGYLSIFFLAGLQAVPRELYEAADLDGAGPWRKFLSVTLPTLRPVTAFVVVTVLVGSAQIFDEPFLLTQGGPGNATLSVVMFIYRAAFQEQQFGYASAAAVLLFAVVFVMGRIGASIAGVGRHA
ncbi:carbohydrate ABC transporter permease [Sinomonas terrae]|uniref:Sugar ABC transporter permease n=1 Tax=Sinomonas terrae TaxID=2908838 RepID=A0ABS9U6W8_9MICC|nr:sugar ABC transporter permease [Sinomonas terrae]MCH6472107.1 sugar ABC transporter permease [Sinomonas terrae]